MDQITEDLIIDLINIERQLEDYKKQELARVSIKGIENMMLRSSLRFNDQLVELCRKNISPDKLPDIPVFYDLIQEYKKNNQATLLKKE